MCMWVFGGAKINFDRITAFQTLVILGNFLHCRVWSLYNQPLLKFSMDHFETMCSCCGYIEDVHVNSAGEKIIFDKITSFWI